MSNDNNLKSIGPLAGVITAVVIGIAASAGLFKSNGPSAPARVAGDVAVNVSLIQLIATPDKFDGRRVMVKGFLVNEADDRALYLSADDNLNGLDNKIPVSFKNAPVPVDVQEQMNREYVALRGVFHGGSLPVIDGIDHIYESHGIVHPPPLGE